MKLRIFIVIGLLAFLQTMKLQAQDSCFQRLYDLGVEFAAAGGEEFIRALDHFEAARACPDRTNAQDALARDAISRTREAWIQELQRRIEDAQSERDAKEEARADAAKSLEDAIESRKREIRADSLARISGAISEATKLALLTDEETDLGADHADDAIALGFMAMRWSGDSVINRVARAFGNAVYLKYARHFTGDDGGSLGFHFMPGSDRYYLRTYRGPVLIFDSELRSGSIEHTRHAFDLVFDPGDRRMVSLGSDELHVRERAASVSQKYTNDLLQHTTASFSPNGGAFATGGRNGSLTLWDNDLQVPVSGLKANILDIHFAPDGKHFVAITSDNTAAIYTSSGQPVADLTGHERMITHAEYAPDGGKIVTASADGDVRIWDSQGRQLQVIKHPGIVTHAEFSFDGTSVLTACTDGTVRLWTLDGNLQNQFNGHRDWVMHAAFINEQTVLSWSKDGGIYVLDGKLNVSKRVNNTHDGDISEVVLSNTGRHFLIVQGRRVSLWDIEGIEWMSPTAFASEVWAAGFSPNGHHIWACTSDGKNESAWMCIIPEIQDQHLQAAGFRPTAEQMEKFSIRDLSEIPDE